MIIFNNLKYNLKKILDIQKFKKHNNQLFQLKEKKIKIMISLSWLSLINGHIYIL